MTTGPSTADIDQIIERIRNDASTRATRADASAPAADDMISRDFLECSCALSKAEGSARVGMRVPDFHSYTSWRRQLARAAARVVLFFGQVISMQQREFNVSLLAALKHLLRPLRRHDVMLARQENDLERQQSAVRSLQAEVELLRRRLDQVTTAVAEAPALPNDQAEVGAARAA